jgi:phenylalanine ammonia-lyase
MLNKPAGVNTGFGGSADTRTDDTINLQAALIQHQLSGILSANDLNTHTNGNEEAEIHSMPSSWVRGAILIRCNTNIRGHSGVSWDIVDTMIELVRQDMVPIIPLRGSISASGDLMPMSYVAGVLQGNPGVFVRHNQGQHCQVINAEEALKRIQTKNLEINKDKEDRRDFGPITLGPKEGLAIINGTATSATVMSLVMYDVDHLAILSQLITCLNSEALAGNVEWSHRFLADVRPHRGQQEVSRNMRLFFDGSKLVSGLYSTKDRVEKGLVQDRYAVRTSSQWIGPQLEELCMAKGQIEVELNSSTDNPIVNIPDQDVHSGGNFQAMSVSMPAEKARLCLQLIGKMLFAQTTELLNPSMNNGLPPNLAPDDPSLSYCLKGVDINMAAYQSELGFLANPVTSHVQSAEMHNQAINSLALVSARYTMQSVELLSSMSAAAIYAGLQGVDVRVLHKTFLEQLQPSYRTCTIEVIGRLFVDDAATTSFYERSWKRVTAAWYTTSTLDVMERCGKVAGVTVDLLPECLAYSELAIGLREVLDTIAAWRKILQKLLFDAFMSHRERFMNKPTTLSYLGRGSSTLYNFVRNALGVPMHRGLVESPKPGGDNLIDGRPKKTIGFWISLIYDSMKDGRLHEVVLEGLADLIDTDEKQ